MNCLMRYFNRDGRGKLMPMCDKAQKIVTARVAKRVKVMFSQAFICSICGGGGVTWNASWDRSHDQREEISTSTPQDRTTSPPGPGQHPTPRTRPPPPTYGNYGQCAGGTHPTGMQSCKILKSYTFVLTEMVWDFLMSLGKKCYPYQFWRVTARTRHFMNVVIYP